jgi:hypothetical protein
MEDRLLDEKLRTLFDSKGWRKCLTEVSSTGIVDGVDVMEEREDACVITIELKTEGIKQVRFRDGTSCFYSSTSPEERFSSTPKGVCNSEMELGRTLFEGVYSQGLSGGLCISFLYGNRRNTTLRYFVGISTYDCTLSSYGCKVVGKIMSTASEDFTSPKQPSPVKYGNEAARDMKVIMNDWCLYQWFKCEKKGRLNLLCSYEESTDFVHAIQNRLSSLDSSAYSAQLQDLPPKTSSMVWLSMSLYFLRVLGLTIYVFASKHVLVVDHEDVLILIGVLSSANKSQCDLDISG